MILLDRDDLATGSDLMVELGIGSVSFEPRGSISFNQARSTLNASDRKRSGTDRTESIKGFVQVSFVVKVYQTFTAKYIGCGTHSCSRTEEFSGGDHGSFHCRCCLSLSRLESPLRFVVSASSHDTLRKELVGCGIDRVLA